MNQADKAKLLLKVNDDLFAGKIDKELVNQAYRLIPNLSDFEFGIEKKCLSIKRYVTFNREELEYDLANSNETIDEIQEHIFNMETPTIQDIIENDMPTELINKQTGNQEQVDDYQLEKPATKPKHKGGRPPKGSKSKGKK
jgi:hypothetical protein